MIYLDNAATTRIDHEVLDTMMPYLTTMYGNAGTIYKMGRDANIAVEKARRQVADFIGGAMPEQIIFTSGGTEANNLVFQGISNYLISNGKNHIVSSAIEHDSVLNAIRKVCSQKLFDFTLVRPDGTGHIDPQSIKSVLRDGITGLVSVMYVNNETGSENDIIEIARTCRDNGVLFHTDCVQAAGCSPIDVHKIGCDFLTISSHKIHGPKGVGALYARDPSVLQPLIAGGAFQEFGLRGGTENVAGIVGFGKACEIAREHLRDSDVRCSVLKQLFFSHLKNNLDFYGCGDIIHINGDPVIKHGKTINMRFDGVDGETLLLMLDSKDVYVSAGSACTSHESKPSHVLTAMGVTDEDARNSIRVSFSRLNTEEEVCDAAQIIASCVNTIRLWR